MGCFIFSSKPVQCFFSSASDLSLKPRVSEKRATIHESKALPTDFDQIFPRLNQRRGTIMLDEEYASPSRRMERDNEIDKLLTKSEQKKTALQKQREVLHQVQQDNDAQNEAIRQQLQKEALMLWRYIKFFLVPHSAWLCGLAVA